MNQPEYIIVDEFRELVASMSVALTDNDSTTFPNPINYQHGYITELNETLMQYEKDPQRYDTKFPLVWLAQPFTVTRGEVGYYGKVNDLRLFIINSSDKNWKADEREDSNFNPKLRPIYRELIDQLKEWPAFDMGKMGDPVHKVIDRYYWGESQQSVLNDIVDCMEISGMEFKVKNNSNCP